MSAHQRWDGILERPLTLRDLPAIMEIERRAYEFPWTSGIFSDCLRVGYTCWGLEECSRLRAYCITSMAAGEAHILNLCVDPSYQGMGLGGRLLRCMMALAARRGIEDVLLEVRPSNEAALALYRRHGFVRIGERKGYYPTRFGREDAVVMKRSIAPDPCP
ncbi:MAG TPA: ribosomal protein S18-alanine N-acetyltransferase [Candidatus Acidoferrales bacterium]|nr:ribosomal protein S18-alanine N-acetyltransferase [Candidatus Acidoferrales bacterium]